MNGEKGRVQGFRGFWLGAALCLLVLQAVWIHVGDLRCYNQDVGRTHARALEIVDQHRFVWDGNPIKDNLHLGPLANVLAAVPLVFTRDIFRAHHFLTLLMALSWILFYLALRRALGPGPGARIGALAWAFLYFQLYMPLRVVNSAYVPFFLPVYFYFLVLYAQRPRKALVPVLWLSVGLLMNMNLSCMLLFFPTVAATRPWRSARDAGVFAAGTALVAGLHFHLILMGLQMMGDGALVSLLARGRSCADVLGDLGANAARFAVLTPAVLGPALVVFGLLAFRRNPDARSREGQAVLLRASAWALAAALILVPLLFTAKGGVRPRYAFYATPFLCWLVGLWFQKLGEKPGEGKRWLAWTALFFVLLVGWQGLSFWYVPWTSRHHYWNMMRLKGQMAVADRLAELIRDRGLENVEVDEIVLEREGPGWSLKSRSTTTFAGLIPYLHPDLASRVGTLGTRKILVVVTPAPTGPVPWQEPETTVEARYFRADIHLDPGGVPPYLTEERP
ncbi:MAG: hypothetical protein KKA60_04340 [Proteobacteria bacterium]|nr:hypothetical protein [Pseudomonadota bacterium]